jgi:hypothetical protein
MAAQGGAAVSDLIWPSEAQMRRIEPYFFAFTQGATVRCSPDCQRHRFGDPQ